MILHFIHENQSLSQLETFFTRKILTLEHFFLSGVVIFMMLSIVFLSEVDLVWYQKVVLDQTHILSHPPVLDLQLFLQILTIYFIIQQFGAKLNAQMRMFCV